MANSFYDMDSIKYEYDFDPETIFDYIVTPESQVAKSLPNETMPLVPATSTPMSSITSLDSTALGAALDSSTLGAEFDSPMMIMVSPN